MVVCKCLLGCRCLRLRALPPPELARKVRVAAVGGMVGGRLPMPTPQTPLALDSGIEVQRKLAVCQLLEMSGSV